MKKTKKLPLVEIIAILDRSGSMSSIQREAIGSFNNFLSEQKKVPGDVKMTTVLFDDQYEILNDGVMLTDIPDLNDKTFVPRGMTALYDAVGKTITTVSERLSKTSKSKMPAKVIMMILTDGAENASKEYNSSKIKELIDTKKDWEFIYLASDMTQFKDEAFRSAGNTFNFAATNDPKDGRSFGYKGETGASGVSMYMSKTVLSARAAVYDTADKPDTADSK